MHPLIRFAVVVTAGFALLACSGKEDGAPPEVQAVASEDKGQQAPAEFAISSQYGELYEGRPSVVLKFSEPVVSSQAFDTLVSIANASGARPDGSWVLGQDNELRFPWLEPDTTYTVSVKGELASVRGPTLGKNLDLKIDSGAQAPLVGFASQGVILPQHDTRGLPVVSVNLDAVDIEFFKVRDSSLSSFLSAFERNGRKSYWTLQNVAVYADSVYANRFALDAKGSERVTSHIAVRDIDELHDTGVYFAVMKRPGSFEYEFDTAMFFVSDIGVHVRRYANQTLIVTTSLESGAAKPNVELEFRHPSRGVVGKATTDATGLALIKHQPNSEQLLLAHWGDDLTVLAFNQPALDLTEFALAGEPFREREVFAWSGRDLYRPGEMLGISALLRDADGKSVPAQSVFVSLKQPDGRELSRREVKPGDLNYLRYESVVPADAPTGRWSVELSTDPNMSKPVRYPIRVEEFIPERLKLNLNAQETLAPGEPLSLTAEGAWLYGSPAAGNRFTARLTVQVDQHPIQSLKDFFFSDALMDLPAAPRDVVEDGELDEEGKLSADIAIDEATAPTGPVQVVVAGSVYESGGRAVTRALKRTIWPAEAIVGVRPLFDMNDGATPESDAEFEIIRANAAGEALASKPLKVKLLREERHYNWRWVDGGGWTSDFTSNWNSDAEQDITLAAGQRGRFGAPVNWGGYRLEITDPETGLTTRVPFQAGWNWYNDAQTKGSRPDKVKLALDKAGYQPGDTIKLTIKPPHAGEALVLVESDQLLWQKRLTVSTETSVEIPFDPSWERHDLYATALVFRPGDAAEKITPNRAVGVTHIPLARADRKLEVSVDAPEKARPEQVATVSVKAPALAGKQAQVVLTAVDLGILNITQFALPDPAGFFFAPRQFMTESYDVFNRIIEALDGNKARLRYGGDAAMLALPAGRRPNVKVQTIDLYQAPTQFDGSGNAQIALTLPDFNGTLRLVAVAYDDQRFGTGSRELIVQAPLVVELAAPRAMASGDKAEIAVDLENLSGADSSLNVQLEGGDLINVGEAKRSLKLADKGRQTLKFPITARDRYGVARITVKVNHNAGTFERNLEFAVRPAYPIVRRNRTLVLTGNDTVTPASNLREGLVADSVASRINLGTLPPLPFAAAARDLIDYPYGCVEQTTSKAFPIALMDEATQQQFAISPLSDARRKELMSIAFSRLLAMQNENGHFSMWPGDGYQVTYMTPYVADMLVTARENGFEPPEQLIERALKRLNDDMLSGGNSHYEYSYSEHLRVAEMAYAGYVLARLKRAPLGTLRVLYDNEREKLVTPLPLVHLGVALRLMGDEERGNKALDEAFSREFKRPDYVGDYGTELRDMALMVATALEQKMSKPEYEAKVMDLAREYEGGRAAYWSYLSTQEQIALVRLGRGLREANGQTVSGDVTIGDNAEPFSPTRFISRTFTAPDLAAGVRIQPESEGQLFLSEDVVGYPNTAPEQKFEGVSIYRQYFYTDGREYDGEPLTSGDVLVAAIRVQADAEMRDALVVDLLPGGLEIENLNLVDSSVFEGVTIYGQEMEYASTSSEFQYQEFRDDRYVAALRLYDGQESKLFYLVRAVSPGEYRVPSPMVEDMYRPKLRGIGAAKPGKIVVREP